MLGKGGPAKPWRREVIRLLFNDLVVDKAITHYPS